MRKLVFSLTLLLVMFIFTSVSSAVFAQGANQGSQSNVQGPTDMTKIVKALMEAAGITTPGEISHNTFMGRDDLKAVDSGLKDVVSLNDALDKYGQILVDFQGATKDFAKVLNKQGTPLKIEIATGARGFLDRCYIMLENEVRIPAENLVGSTDVVQSLVDDNRYLQGWLAEHGLPIKIETLYVEVDGLSTQHIKIYGMGGEELNFRRIVVTGNMNGNRPNIANTVYTIIPHMDGTVTLLAAMVTNSPLASGGRFETKLVPILSNVTPQYAADCLNFRFVSPQDIQELGL